MAWLGALYAVIRVGYGVRSGRPALGIGRKKGPAEAPLGLEIIETEVSPDLLHDLAVEIDVEPLDFRFVIDTQADEHLDRLEDDKGCNG